MPMETEGQLKPATHEQSWRTQQQREETSAEDQQHMAEFPHMRDD